MDALADAFDPVRGLPSWEVKRGHGSFLTLEFGPPSVVMDDVRTLPSFIAGERLRVPRRVAYVRGAWHLWIYCCVWSLSWHAREIAHSESQDVEMDRALSVLNGQSLTAVAAGTPDGHSSFAFDLSCFLATRPEEDADAYQEQWMFFQPSGDILSLRADGGLYTERPDAP